MSDLDPREYDLGRLTALRNEMGAAEPDELWERSLRHLDVDDLSLLATALEEKSGNWRPGVGFDWRDNRAEELWFVICMVLEVEGNRPVWQQTHVYPHGDQRWWATTRNWIDPDDPGDGTMFR